jgi:hypothetical protein
MNESNTVSKGNKLSNALLRIVKPRFIYRVKPGRVVYKCLIVGRKYIGFPWSKYVFREPIKHWIIICDSPL